MTQRIKLFYNGVLIIAAHLICSLAKLFGGFGITEQIENKVRNQKTPNLI